MKSFQMEQNPTLKMDRIKYFAPSEIKGIDNVR